MKLDYYARKMVEIETTCNTTHREEGQATDEQFHDMCVLFLSVVLANGRKQEEVKMKASSLLP